MSRHLCEVTGPIFCVKKVKEATTYLIGKSSDIKMVYDCKAGLRAAHSSLLKHLKDLISAELSNCHKFLHIC